jgi:hypothetical protein
MFDRFGIAARVALLARSIRPVPKDSPPTYLIRKQKTHGYRWSQLDLVVRSVA